MILLFVGLLALGSAGKPAPSGTQWPEQCGHSLGSFVTDAVEHCDVPRLRVLENWVRWANNTFPGRGRGPPTGGDNDCDGLCVDGKDGLACWDNDADSVCDDAEDVNRDGFCDVLDCKGRNGADGRDGRDGHNGVACWDTNGDGHCNKPQEDTNGDGACNVLDCRGRDGQDGAPGTCPDTCTGSGSGQACWDLNNDGECTRPDEDTNGDGKCDVYDCRGRDGNDGDEGPQGPPGPQGTCPDTCTGGGVVTNGTDGLACWDLNGDGLCETDPNSVTGPLEDTNGDSLCDARDCKAADGQDGADASFNTLLCPGESLDEGDMLTVSANPDPKCLLSRPPAPSSGGECGPRVAWVPTLQSESSVTYVSGVNGFYRICGSYVEYGLRGRVVPLASSSKFFQLKFFLPHKTTVTEETVVGHITGRGGMSAAGVVELDSGCNDNFVDNNGLAAALFITDIALSNTEFYLHGEYNIAEFEVAAC